MRLLCGLLLLLGALRATGYAQSVNLAWDAPAPITPPAQLVGYQLQRCLVPVGQPTCVPQDLPGSTSAGTTMTDTPPVSGTYQYAVVALCVQCDNSGGRTLPSNVLTVSVGTVPLSPPGSLAATVLLPQALLTVSADTQEPVGPYSAPLVLDGLPGTFWHTPWRVAPKPPLPHWLRFDLPSEYWVQGLRYLPRQDGQPQGTIAQYRVEVSRNGLTWQTVATGSWPAGAGPREARFPAVLAKAVKFVALTEVNGDPSYASAAEMHLIQGAQP